MFQKKMWGLIFGALVLPAALPAQYRLVNAASSSFSENSSLVNTRVGLPDVGERRSSAPTDLETRYLFIVTTDGLRWNEVFTGADSTLLFDGRSAALDTGAAATRFWSSDAHERRTRLLPFVWSTMEQHGQLYGNRTLGSNMDVTNRYAVSYPGYNELFTGRPDNLRIFGNGRFHNPNTNIFGFLHRHDRWKGKVAVFSSWNVFRYILNARRWGVPVSCGRMNWRRCRRSFPQNNAFEDCATFAAAREFAAEKHPHVLYIALNATDRTGHEGNYPAHLQTVHRFDRYLAEIWDFIQNDPMYRGRTTLLVTTDHGRGGGSVEAWSGHGRRLAGSHEVWMMALGPDTPPTGEHTGPVQLGQHQFAQTATHLLGLEFRRRKRIGPAIAMVYARHARWATNPISTSTEWQTVAEPPTQEKMRPLLWGKSGSWRVPVARQTVAKRFYKSVETTEWRSYAADKTDRAPKKSK